MELKVVIVGKTKMQRGICLGGILLSNGRSVRLLNKNGDNWASDIDIAVGEVYQIAFTDGTSREPPHSNEDILVEHLSLKLGKYDTDKLIEIIKTSKVPLWRRGVQEDVFEGKLKRKNKSLCILKEAIPKMSTGFWRLPYDIEQRGEYYNLMDNGEYFEIKYVGCLSTPPKKIPKGTLVRLSLAGWWDNDGKFKEERCYLQLSGWFSNDL